MFLIVLYSLTIFTSSSTRESSKEVGSYVKRKGDFKVLDTLNYSRVNHVSFLEALERMDGKASSNADKIRIVELIAEYESIICDLLLYETYLKRYETDTREGMEGSTFEYERNKIRNDIIKLRDSLDKTAKKIGGLSIRIKLMKILIFISKYFILYFVF